MVDNILITGATGTLGSEVVRQLAGVDSEVNIKAAGHSLQNLERIIEDHKIKSMRIDFSEPETLKDALKDIDKVFLLTPFQPNMVQYSSNLLTEIIKAGKTKHIVKVSAMGADFEPGGRLHRQAEQMIEDSGIAYTFLRPNAFMQNFVNFYSHMIKERDVLSLPAGDGKVSFVDVRDIAAVSIQILINNNVGKYNSKTYDITGPEAISYDDAVRILSEQVGKKISYVSVSEDDAFNAMKEMGLNDWLIKTILEGYNNLRKGYFSPITNVVEEITGRKPVSFKDFAKDHAEVFR
ncbi:MAG TPA: SDR family oxidoreductase [Nitrososphaeraceae archaeon]|nr:SDR family oxidoreductase [Nitrososphaeraceae archaeon]